MSDTIFTNPTDYSVPGPILLASSYPEIELPSVEFSDSAVAAPAPITTQSFQDLGGLVSKTFFIRVSYGTIGNTRKLSGASILTTDADVSLLNVSKTLLESPELDAVRKHDTSLRKWLGNSCLPFVDWPGVLVLPKGLLTNAKGKFDAHAAERQTLVDAFITAYPARVEEAKKSLGSLFDPSEYPSIPELKDKFKFSWHCISFETPDALKEIDPELWAQQTAAHQQKIAAATDEITAVMRETLLDMTTHLKERLTPGEDGKPRILRESAIENLREFLNNFDLRNVTDDKALALEVAKARALLSGTSANTLRNSDEWREKIRVGMESITATLGGMTEEQNGRKFRG